MYEIIFSDNALKQLQRLEIHAKERILNALERIKIRPQAYVKKLIGNHAFRLRVGEYRILMDIDNNKLLILVIKVAHRRNVYK